MFASRPVYAGGPCTCAPNRYVRFAVIATLGCEGVISCRSNDGTGKDSLREHPIPATAHVEVRCPDIRHDLPVVWRGTVS